MNKVKVQHRWLLPLLIILGLFLDGSLSLVFSNSFFANNLQMVPQLFVLAIVMCTFADEETSLLFWYSLMGGLAYDLFYTGLIGQYTLIGPITFLLTKFLMAFFLDQAIYQLAAFIINVLIGQVILYGLGTFFGMTSVSTAQFISNALAPTIILNVVLFLVFFWPSRKLLSFMDPIRGR